MATAPAKIPTATPTALTPPPVAAALLEDEAVFVALLEAVVVVFPLEVVVAEPLLSTLEKIATSSDRTLA
jgi:hypothetical protein